MTTRTDKEKLFYLLTELQILQFRALKHDIIANISTMIVHTGAIGLTFTVFPPKSAGLNEPHYSFEIDEWKEYDVNLFHIRSAESFIDELIETAINQIKNN